MEPATIVKRTTRVTIAEHEVERLLRERVGAPSNAEVTWTYADDYTGNPVRTCAHVEWAADDKPA